MCSKKKTMEPKKQKKRSKLIFVSENPESEHSEDNSENEHWPNLSLEGNKGKSIG